MGDRLCADPSTSRRQVTRDFSERGKADDPPIGANTGAVHPGAADDPHAPAPVGAGTKHGKGVVSHQILSGPPAAGNIAADTAVIERQVGSGEAVDPDVRDRPPIRIRADLITDRADGPIDRLECLQPAEPGVTGALPPSRSQDPAAPIEQHDVGLGVPAINRQDRGAHRFTHA